MPHVIKNGHFTGRRMRRKVDRRRRVRFDTWISGFDNKQFFDAVYRQQTAFLKPEDKQKVMEVITLTAAMVKRALKAKPTWEE